VHADEQVGHELEHHGVARAAHVDGARQHRFQHGPPAVVDVALAAHEDDAVAARHHAGRAAHRAVEERLTAPGGEAGEALGEARRDRAHLNDHARPVEGGDDLLHRGQRRQHRADGLAPFRHVARVRGHNAAEGHEGVTPLGRDVVADHRVPRRAQARSQRVTEQSQPHHAHGRHGAEEYHTLATILGRCLKTASIILHEQLSAKVLPTRTR
jgi:hypothetical protein